ncbi:MAG TPA: hypothetical protein VFX70_05820 [Mycobacteriales bacterium]|nr:hypothetical protein [Mycobacteriales bacterium]
MADTTDTGYVADDGWAERLREARAKRFRTTWQAAKALGALDPRLPSLRQLHRYWSQRWETGRTRPNRTYRELIEHLLDTPGLFTGETPAPAEPAEDTTTSTVGAGSSGRPGSSGFAGHFGGSNWWIRPHSVVDSDHNSRAELAKEVRMAAGDAADHAARSDSGAGDRTVEQLQGEVVRQARDYTHRPLPEVFADARQTRDAAAGLVDRTRRPAQLADLYAVAGQACGLLATAAFDMGYWDSAGRLAGSALTYAELAGHDSLRAWVLGRQADLANWQGRPDDALNRLGDALVFAPAGTCAVRLHAIAARSRALLGDRSGVERDIHAAEEARQSEHRDELHDSTGGEFGFVPARQEYNAGSAYTVLQDGTAAERHSQRAVEMYESLPVADRAYYAEYGARVDLAAARVLRGDLSGARHALLTVFALAPAQRVAGVLGRLDQVRQLLAADIYRDSREARQLTNDITDFTTTTPPHQLPPEPNQ